MMGSSSSTGRWERRVAIFAVLGRVGGSWSVRVSSWCEAADIFAIVEDVRYVQYKVVMWCYNKTLVACYVQSPSPLIVDRRADNDQDDIAG